MKRRILVHVVAFVVVGVFALGIWSTEGSFQPSWLRFYSAAVLTALLVVALWDYVLWRVPWAQRVPLVPRDLRGTWRGTLSSMWKDPTTLESPPPKTVYLVIRQTAFRTSVLLLTDESRSTSSMAQVSNDGTTVSLDYMYLSFPDSRLEERSRIHHGSTSFVVAGLPATRLRGRYWTNRDSRGELDFSDRVNTLADDFEAAQCLFS